MKKSKLMVGVLVASIALLGTGYAYWTDQLTLNSTVGTGKLDIIYNYAPDLSIGELEETKASSSDQFSEKPSTPGNPEDAYISFEYEKIAKPFKDLKFNFDGLFPGSFVTVEFVASNVGSIPAVIDNVEASFSGSQSLRDKLEVELTGSYLEELNSTGAALPLTNQPVKGSLNDLEKLMTQLYGNVKIGPAGMVTTHMKITFPGNAATGNQLEGEKFGMEVKTNWIQHNALTTAEKATEPQPTE